MKNDISKILLFTDYRNQFYFSTKERGASIDLKRLSNYFLDNGFKLIIRSFFDIDFRKENFKDQFIMYQSSEDPSLLYKDYIQDIVLGLQYQGAILLPSIYYFRAHHNKLFMEIVRDLVCGDVAGNIVSNGYGTYEEYKKDILRYRKGRYVLKPDSGTRSKGVQLMTTLKEKIKLPLKISKTFTFHNLKWKISKLFSGKPYVKQSNNRKKFIVQNFIDGLDGDYRVIVYGNKYYVLYRKNRENDFRASGSGNLNFDIKLPDGLLDYSKKVFERFDTPYVSLDIGHKNGEFFLFEFQFMCLGQYALEKSEWYYSLENNSWVKNFEKPDLEREISNSVIEYINRK